MVGLEAVYVVKGEEATAQHSETRGSPNTVNWFSLLVGSTCCRNTLIAIIAGNRFVHSYLHYSIHYLSLSNVVVDVPSNTTLLPLSRRSPKDVQHINVFIVFELACLLTPD